jgi:hypothetical protein
MLTERLRERGGRHCGPIGCAAFASTTLVGLLNLFFFSLFPMHLILRTGGS